jgi:hypothetical protein
MSSGNLASGLFSVRVGLVTDSEWQDGQYWVKSAQGVQPYAELAAMFTLKVMKRMLGLDNGN